MRSKQTQHPYVSTSMQTLRRKTLCLAVAACFSGTVLANPTGGNVVRGSASISSSGSTLTVANTPGAIIHWDNFSIAEGETTVFNQVNAASSVLNRVTGGNVSQILGALQSNGQVFLINPSGIVFGANAVVNVAGLVASTLNISDTDFINGRMRFAAEVANAGSVTNHGTISTPTGGYVYLMAPNVENNGIITTPSGEAILAAGNTVELVDSTDPRQRVSVRAENENVNLSQMMVQSNGNIFSVLNRGTVSANTVQQDATGRIFFKSAGTIQTTASSVVETKGTTALDGGTFVGFADTAGFYAGKFDANGKNGGFIETSGRYLDVAGIQLSARALAAGGKAGDWLLDPFNITIATGNNNISAGPTFTPTGTGSTISAATLEAALNAGTNVTIDTAGAGSENGDININASIAKTAGGDSTLTFNADGAITMGANVQITDSGSGKLSVTMLSDRDGTGSIGGITATYIDVAGDVNLKTNSGGFSFAGVTSFQSVNGANVGLDIAGNVTLQGGTTSSESKGIYATNGDVKIKSGGVVNLLSGTDLTTYTEIRATNKVEIETQGGLNLTGGSANNTVAIIRGDGKVTVKSGGDVTLTGGSGNVSKAVIESINSDVKIEFSSQRSLTLAGSSASTNEGFAVIDAFNGDVEIKGDIAAHNPNITITGGGATGQNYAGITGKTISNISAGNVSLLAGPSNPNPPNAFGTTGGDAFIAAIGPSAISSRVNINATGLVTLGSGGAKAEIGSTDGVVTINANSVELNGTSGIAGIGNNSANNVTVNITANAAGSSGVILDGANARIGNAGGGSAVVNITGINDNSNDTAGVAILNGASIGSSGGGSVTITGTGWSGGGRGIQVTNASINSGNISLNGTGQGSGNQDGVFMDGTASVTASGNISIIGTGSATGFSAAGVSLADNTNITAGGNVLIDGTGQSSSGNSFGVVLFGGSTPVSSTVGNVSITGTSVVSTAVALNTANITANAGSVNIIATNNNISLDNSQISAGTAVNLSAASGTVVQTSSGSIITPKLNINALNINMAGLLNSFNAALFNTPLITALNNTATGTGTYQFLQNTTLMQAGVDDAFDTLNINADQGLIIDGSGSGAGGGTLDGTINVNALSLTLTNGASISADTIEVKANALTVDSGSSLNVNTLTVNANTVNLNNATIDGQNGSIRFAVVDTMTLSDGAAIDSGENLNIAANALTMSNSDISSVGDTNIITNNLQMSNASISGENVNVNSANLAFALSRTNLTNANVATLFRNITRNAIINLQNSSFIEGTNNVNVAGAQVSLNGSEISSGNITTVFSRGDITLEGGQVTTNTRFGSQTMPVESKIFATNEILLVSGGQLNLNDGASGAGSVVETDSPNTIFLAFPRSAADAYFVNGVANAITNGNSGFFAGGAPVVLGTNFFVAYGATSNGILATFINQNLPQAPSLTLLKEVIVDKSEDNKINKECS